MTERAPLWLDSGAREKPGQGRLFFTTDRYPLFYLQITKCGCTFLRNLIYYLDHDQEHPHGGRIHTFEDDFIKAALVPRSQLQQSPYMFTVVRDPMDRFLSLYFDKIANPHNTTDVKIKKNMFKNARLKRNPRNKLGIHQHNCVQMLRWLDSNMAGETRLKINPHWQRQSARIARAGDMGLRFVTLDGLNWQLPALLSPLIPDIATKMNVVKTRNTSPKPIAKSDVVTPEIEALVSEIYAEDAAHYTQVNSEWGVAPGNVA